GPRRGDLGDHREPASRSVGGHRLREPEHAVRTAVAGDQPAVALETRLERERAVEALLQEAAALAAEVERGPDALRGQRQALARRVADREDLVDGGAGQPGGEVGPGGRARPPPVVTAE